MTNDEPCFFMLYILKGCAFIYYPGQKKTLFLSSGVGCALPRCIQLRKPFNVDLNPHRDNKAKGFLFNLD